MKQTEQDIYDITEAGTIIPCTITEYEDGSERIDIHYPSYTKTQWKGRAQA